MLSFVPQSRWKFWLTLSVGLSLFVVGTISYFGWRQMVPGVRASLLPPPKYIGLRTAVTLTLAATRGGVQSVELRVVQGTTKVVAARQEFTPPRPREQRVQLTVEGRSLKLREGSATLEVHARDDFWRPVRLDAGPVLTHPVSVDVTPPSLDLLSATQYLHQGGGGLVVYRVKGAERSGVSAGDRFFPGFPTGDRERGDHVAMLALPVDLPTTAPLLLTAQDEAGNSASRTVPSTIRAKKFPADSVELTEEFLRRKLPELLPEKGEVGGDQLLDAFLLVNREKRREAEETKRQVATKTQGTPLWRGAFLQPRNTKVFSNFAETRSYRFRGRDVDSQVHWGYDLASLKASPVPAANSGIVVFAGPLTIYGNTVILDHGLGLATLYGHLSRIDVNVGDSVEKGAELGRTGSTGLAVGDHLHYEVLIHGIPVTPLEWWDARWIRDHVTRPLREAGVALIEGDEIKEEPATSPKPSRRRPRR
jgi:murein DD-endopeptidase MepM/ murein hydrolase activator NlpD